MHCFLLECIWIHFNEFIYLVNKHLLRIYSVLYPEHIIKTNNMWVDYLYMRFSSFLVDQNPFWGHINKTFKIRISHGRIWISVYRLISHVIPAFGPTSLHENTLLALKYHYQESSSSIIFRGWRVLLRLQVYGFPKTGTQVDIDMLSWCVTTAEMQKWAKSFVLSL